jgi:hypothetical protein
MSNPTDREDFLEEDAEISGQKFCLLSFLSPEKVLADKNLFFFGRFLQTYEFQSRTKGLEAYLMKMASEFNTKLDAEADSLLAKDLSGAADVCRKSKARIDTMMDEFHQFVKNSERDLKESKLKEAYDDFIFAGKAKLEDEFFAKNEFRTTVRGLKVRGVYGSQGEAVARSKKLQRQDPLHNIFVGEVGKWLPWDPEPADVPEQEYAEDQLNNLMKKYKENEEAREQFHREQRGRASSKKATVGESGITVVSDSAEKSESFSDMFGSAGPADLAIQRKTEAAAKASGNTDLSGASA